MSTDDTTITRRTLIAGGAGIAGVATLAACASGGSGHEGKGSGRQPADKALARLADVAVGQAVAVDLPTGSPGILCRPTAATAVCFSAICTHAGCTVAPEGTKLTCPCHGSEFDARTGKVLRGPAVSPLPAVPVRVTNGRVVTG